MALGSALSLGSPEDLQPMIFISYRRSDSDGQALALHKDLSTTFGATRVFLDVAGLEKGRDFRELIAKRLGSCSVFLAVVGPDWLRVADSTGRRRIDSPNDFVRLETAAALKRGIPVIPVLVRGASMPTEAELPEDLRALIYRDGVELTHARWNSDVAALVDALRSHAGTTLTKQLRRRWILASAALVGSAALVATVAINVRAPTPGETTTTLPTQTPTAPARPSSVEPAVSQRTASKPARPQSSVPERSVVAAPRTTAPRTSERPRPAASAIQPPVATPPPAMPAPAPKPPPAVAALDIQTDPAGARVVVNGAPYSVGQVFPASQELRVQATLPGHYDRMEKVVLATGERRTLRIRLSACPIEPVFETVQVAGTCQRVLDRDRTTYIETMGRGGSHNIACQAAYDRYLDRCRELGGVARALPLTGDQFRDCGGDARQCVGECVGTMRISCEFRAGDTVTEPCTKPERRRVGERRAC